MTVVDMSDQVTVASNSSFAWLSSNSNEALWLGPTETVSTRSGIPERSK